MYLCFYNCKAASELGFDLACKLLLLRELRHKQYLPAQAHCISSAIPLPGIRVNSSKRF